MRTVCFESLIWMHLRISGWRDRPHRSNGHGNTHRWHHCSEHMVSPPSCPRLSFEATLAISFSPSSHICRLPRITAATAGVGTCKSPLLQCHGTDDPVVLFDWGKQSFEKARELGMAGDFKSYPVSIQTSPTQYPTSSETRPCLWTHCTPNAFLVVLIYSFAS